MSVAKSISIEEVVDRNFAAVVFDWDGTAVPDRATNAQRLRSLLWRLSEVGVDVAIISGTHLANIDGQLDLRPPGPGRLLISSNRGSELFEVTETGPVLLHRRIATEAENSMLDRAADDLAAFVESRGLEVRIVRDRMNRRKLDLLPGRTDPPKSEIAALVTEVDAVLSHAALPDLAGMVDAARRAAIWSGLDEQRVTTDAKHIEIGLTDKREAMELVLDTLANAGISPGLVLIAGDEFGPLGGAAGSDARMLSDRTDRATVVSVGIEPEGVPAGVRLVGGGPDAFARVLDRLWSRYENSELPAVDLDPAWTVTIDEPPGRRVSADAIFSLSDGAFGAREGYGDRTQLVAAGIYTSLGDAEMLLDGPISTDITDELRLRRRHLDLSTGVLVVEEEGATTVAFASRARPGAHAIRTETERAVASLPQLPLRLPDSCRRGSIGHTDGPEPVHWAVAESSHGGSIATAARDHVRTSDDRVSVERLLAHVADPDRVIDPGEAVKGHWAMAELGYDVLLREQRAAWADAWSRARVDIEGDPALELATRFAVFHLLANAPAPGTSGAIGARGLSGRAYAGHVFWDTDVFVLPTLTAIAPTQARCAIRYRIDRLATARHAARRSGRAGARFPWESAATGEDVTPRSTVDPHGETVPILTGDHEEHITADVAWAVSRYVDWTGDETVLADGGADIIIEAAAYWASRVEEGDDGLHISQVIGPDEYHELIDDNAFTNLMARWTLKRASALVDDDRADEWRSIAGRLVDGFDAVSGTYDQFTGFSDLEPLVIGQLHDVPVAADLLLGRDRIARSQVIKQADVLMAHRMIPGEMRPDSLHADLERYVPLTAHGSSLSPPIHAALLARDGRPDEALALYEMAANMDLADLTATGLGGLHLATMGGLWQALVTGFAGMTVVPDGIVLIPNLPSTWNRVGFRCLVRACQVDFSVRADRVEIRATRAMRVRVGDTWASGTDLRFDRNGDRWETQR